MLFEYIITRRSSMYRKTEVMQKLLRVWMNVDEESE